MLLVLRAPRTLSGARRTPPAAATCRPLGIQSVTKSVRASKTLTRDGSHQRPQESVTPAGQGRSKVLERAKLNRHPTRRPAGEQAVPSFFFTDIFNISL